MIICNLLQVTHNKQCKKSILATTLAFLGFFPIDIIFCLTFCLTFNNQIFTNLLKVATGREERQLVYFKAGDLQITLALVLLWLCLRNKEAGSEKPRS